jgi:hypothetical protein
MPFPFLSAAGAQVAGSAASAFGSFLGARATNQANKKMAREQMRFQKKSVREQMAWQQHMSSTAYQRAIADMKKAGINPILAYQQGGASTPSGASSAGSSARMEDTVGKSLASAIETRRMFAELKNLQEQNRKLSAEADLASSQVPQSKIVSSFYTKLGDLLGINEESGTSAKYITRPKTWLEDPLGVMDPQVLGSKTRKLMGRWIDRVHRQDYRRLQRGN